MPGKMCHDVSGDKKSIGNWQMETAVSRDGLVTFWHQSGTDKMGGNAMSVVDGQTTTTCYGMRRLGSGL
jgi:hypothetical protein